MNFSASLNGQSYTDPVVFATDVKATGLVAKHPYTPQTLRKRAAGEPPVRPILTKVETEWLGMNVRLRDGREGQVWALADIANYLHVVLVDQRTVKVHKDDCEKVASIRLAGEVLS